ncbi:hypothetical protein LJ753_14835 [Arthrobacter sp. zg-Y20]|uniref:hypothetical protein n=1 Tax=unclassified Arthrobacter TaxID=235627 RepID=UPI001D151E2A|nr:MULTISPECIES: hypothetical protein [unclassified Arthrobacter]MCC3277142.1 hypothetical protein [Arthrobacter sp. zg-Y20]MDK1317303.1 hypothetical protein [Arthrobacter sp. zg.Y20]WIB07385.1 hypothetical protein QNO06_06645 [Arthrobacter sp. zg-Y20]
MSESMPRFRLHSARPRRTGPRSRALRVRRWANIVNLSTPAGLALARFTGCRVRPGPNGVLLAEGYPLALPRAAAFTVGNVILYPGSTARRITADNSPLLRHEMRHSTQYALLGPFFLPLYAAASVLSRAAAGDPASANPFERLAGIHDGGYRPEGIRGHKG